jgi:phosphatidylglycerophosphate synthase
LTTQSATAEQLTYGEALARLQMAQKPGAGVPAYLRWVNRPCGRRLAAMAQVVGLTPNQVTLLSSAVSAVGIVVVAWADPGPLMAVAATAAMLLGYALDSADGQLARLVGSSGPSGEYLDHVADAVRLPLIHLAIAVSLSTRADVDARWPVLVAIGFATVASVWFFAQILADSLTTSKSTAPGAGAPAWLSFVKVPYDVGFLYLLLLVLPWASLFVACYSLLFAFTAAVAALSMWRKYDALRRRAPGA